MEGGDVPVAIGHHSITGRTEARSVLLMVSPLSRVYGSLAVVLFYNLALLALRLVLFLPTLRQTTVLITYISQPP